QRVPEVVLFFCIEKNKREMPFPPQIQKTQERGWGGARRSRTSEADEEIRRSSPSSPSAPMVVGSPPVRVGRRQANQRVPKVVLFFAFKKGGDPPK
ncbi:hypothetical protein ACQCVK_22395, partial [Rossellomorea vietnamensis]|uniref:hypothetical protein n=1 Tax=Rossellomorea vietnamensis TaxID=218284 RepID=UPI003CF909A7